jgi:hypothetical protein
MIKFESSSKQNPNEEMWIGLSIASVVALAAFVYGVLCVWL